jgi:hypothetical protein
MDITDKLKVIITEEYIDLNRKHEPQRNIKNYTNLMVFTNQPNPIYMSGSDRRYLMIRSETQKKPDEYYKNLHAWIDHESTADWLTTWAHKRNLNEFSPTKPPIVTAAKLAVIEASRPGTEQLLVAAKRERSWPLQHDVLTLKALKAAMHGGFTASTLRGWVINAGLEVAMIGNYELVIVDRKGRTNEQLLEEANRVVLGDEKNYYNSGFA